MVEESSCLKTSLCCCCENPTESKPAQSCTFFMKCKTMFNCCVTGVVEEDCKLPHKTHSHAHERHHPYDVKIESGHGDNVLERGEIQIPIRVLHPDDRNTFYVVEPCRIG